MAAAKAALATKKKQKVLPPAPLPDAVAPEKPASPPRPITPPLPPMPKIPLCEPEVHLVYPLVQPAGYNANYTAQMTGSFGSFLFQDVEDPYAYVEEPVVVEPKLETGNVLCYFVDFC